MLHVHLKVIDGKHAGKIIPLTDSKFLIGREEDCHLRPNSELVSRHHCMFSVDQFTVFLRDLGSTNGTFVNGNRLRGKIELKSGDSVSVGKLQFEITVTKDAPVEVPPAEEVLQENSAAQDTVSLESAETDYELPVPAELEPGNSTIIGMPVLPLDASGQPVYPEQQQQQEQQQQEQLQQQQQMPMYPPQQMPMYPPQQMPYPQYPQQYMQPGMYPQMQPMPGYPQQPMMMPPEDAPAEAEALPITLPDPQSTGAQAPPQAKPPEGEGGNAEATPENPSNSAADIIRQYMNRRPGS